MNIFEIKIFFSVAKLVFLIQYSFTSKINSGIYQKNKSKTSKKTPEISSHAIANLLKGVLTHR